MGSACPFLAFCLLLSLPANALFLAGQAEQEGAISVLCEGQSSVFLSLPTGELHALPLDPDFQARFFPASSGPHTFQCGNETKTIIVSMRQRADSGAYSSGENLFLAAGAAIAFLAALLLAAKASLKPCTAFSKSVSGGRVKLFLRAGEELRGIRIIDPQGGEGGKPLQLFIPRLPAGAAWDWEYDENPGEQLLAARLSAKSAKGGISLVSGAGGGGMQTAADMEKAGKRKLKRAA